jgi:uncharacterized membrane protein
MISVRLCSGFNSVQGMCTYGAITTVSRMSDDTTPPPPNEGAAPPPPPPPPPAYGAPPAPPVTPGYGAPPTGAGGYNAVDAIKYGWEKFSKKPAELLVPAIVVILAVVVVEVVIQLVLSKLFLGTHDCTKTFFGERIETKCGPGFFVSLLVAAIASGIGTFASTLLVTGLIRSALDIVDGQPALDIGGVFAWASKPAVVQTALVLGALNFVGTLIFYVGAIPVAFLTAFTLYFVVDKNLAGVEAVKASVSFVISKIGDLIIFFLLSIVVVIVGLIACLVGIFVAIPVLMVAAAYTFRLLHDEPVAPLA